MKLQPPVDYSRLPAGDIACLDIKSFYASIEAVERGLDPFNTAIAVVGNQDQKGSVILAASQHMKDKFNLGTGNRLYEVPDIPEIILVEPRMELYMARALQIIEIYTSYVHPDDIFVYSVDESWLDLNKTKDRHGGTKMMLTKIRNEINNKHGLACSVGVGPNMFLSKVAMDVEGKKTGYASWGYDDIQNKLWPLEVSEVWGIGKQTAAKFNKWGIYTMEDVAGRSLEFFKRRLGIVGVEIYRQAWGIDNSRPGGFYDDKRKSIGRGATLYQDYQKLEEIKTVIFNLSEDIGYRARELGLAGRTVSLYIRYSRNFHKKGFQAQQTLESATNLEHEIMETALELLNQKHQPGSPVRRISVSLSNLTGEGKIQLSLLEDKEKKIKLAKTRDQIRKKFGPEKLDYGLSQAEGSIRERLNSNIGGHKRK
ncbi:MAG: UV damage repair protein UvrX [Halarsenatibacteraceae bacterium]